MKGHSVHLPEVKHFTWRNIRRLQLNVSGLYYTSYRYKGLGESGSAFLYILTKGLVSYKINA